MDRDAFYATATGADTDYDADLNTGKLLSCQKGPLDLRHADEMVFQIVHQVQELWMNATGHTLLDIDNPSRSESTHRALTLFRRIHLMQARLIDNLAVLETLLPIGRWSGWEAPPRCRSIVAGNYAALVEHRLRHARRSGEQVAVSRLFRTHRHRCAGGWDSSKPVSFIWRCDDVG